MLTKELIKGQEVLKNLPDDQLTAIATLSNNNLTAELETAKNKLFGEIHGKYDKLLGEILGIQKPTGKFSSEFWAEQVKELKANAGDPEKLKEANQKITDLETKIKAGAGDKELLAKLETERDQAIAQAEDFKTKYGESETEWKTKFEAKEKEVKDIEVRRLFGEEIGGLKLKDTIPEALRKMALNTVQDSLLAQYDIEVTEDQTGQKRLQYKDKEKGTVLANKDNGLNPFTSLELVTKHDALKDIIDSGTHQNGTGTKGQKPGASFTGNIVDVSGAKTQVEATTLITETLQKQGIARGTEQWKEARLASVQKMQEMNLPLQ